MVLKKIETSTAKKELLIQEKVQEKTRGLASSYRKKLSELYEKVEQETKEEIQQIELAHKKAEEELAMSLEPQTLDEAKKAFEKIIQKCSHAN